MANFKNAHSFSKQKFKPVEINSLIQNVCRFIFIVLVKPAVQSSADLSIAYYIVLCPAMFCPGRLVLDFVVQNEYYILSVLCATAPKDLP